jgi:hypothetical protein
MNTISELTYGDRTYRFRTPQVLHETQWSGGRMLWIETTNDTEEPTDIGGEDDANLGRDAMADMAEYMDATWREVVERDHADTDGVYCRQKAWLLANVEVVEAKS